jgi:hypothetical protein
MNTIFISELIKTDLNNTLLCINTPEKPLALHIKKKGNEINGTEFAAIAEYNLWVFALTAC